MDPALNHISLCTGYGGIDVGLRSVLPSCRTILACEIEAFAIANLVAKMEEKRVDSCPIWTDLHTFDARPFRGLVDIVSGGFPCQPFSHAGKRLATEDPRHLWPAIERIIGECRPSVVFLENVEGIVSSKVGGEKDTSVLKHVLEGLEELGYRATAGIFSAEEVGAPHRRKRVFIAGVADADNAGIQECSIPREGGGTPGRPDPPGCGQSGELADAMRPGPQGQRPECELRETGEEAQVGGGGELADSIGAGLEGHSGDVLRAQGPGAAGEDGPATAPGLLRSWPARPGEQQHDWEPPRTVEPGLGRGTDGARDRVDRLRLLGNGVVPATAAKAFVYLMSELLHEDT